MGEGRARDERELSRHTTNAPQRSVCGFRSVAILRSGDNDWQLDAVDDKIGISGNFDMAAEEERNRLVS